MTRQQHKNFLAQVIKPVAGGPTNVTRAAPLLAALQALVDDVALRGEATGGLPSGIPTFDARVVEYPAGQQVIDDARLWITDRVLSSPIMRPSAIDDNNPWREISAAAPTALYQRLGLKTMRGLQGSYEPGRLYGIARDGESDVWVEALSNNYLTPEAWWLDFATGHLERVAYDLATDTITPLATGSGGSANAGPAVVPFVAGQPVKRGQLVTDAGGLYEVVQDVANPQVAPSEQQTTQYYLRRDYTDEQALAAVRASGQFNAEFSGQEQYSLRQLVGDTLDAAARRFDIAGLGAYFNPGSFSASIYPTKTILVRALIPQNIPSTSRVQVTHRQPATNSAELAYDGPVGFANISFLLEAGEEYQILLAEPVSGQQAGTLTFLAGPAADSGGSTGGTSTSPAAAPLTQEVTHTAAATLTNDDLNKTHALGSSDPAAFSLKLPASPGAATAQLRIRISPSSTGLFTIDGNGNLIDGEPTRKIWASESRDLLWNGTAWRKVGEVKRPLRAKRKGDGQGRIPVSFQSLVQVPLPAVANASLASMVASDSQIKCLRTGPYLVVAGTVAVLSQACTELDLFAAVNGAYNNARSELDVKNSGGFGTNTYYMKMKITDTIDLVEGEFINLVQYAEAAYQIDNRADNPAYSAVLELIEQPTW